MRNHQAVWVALAMALITGGGLPAAEEAALMRWHFAGVTAWQRGTNAAHLANIEQIPATVELRQKTFDKVAQFAPQLLNFGAPTNLGAAIAPLVADLWQFGGYFEVQGVGAQRQALIAVTLPETRRAAWKTGLDQLKSGAGAKLAVLQEGRWTIIATGNKAAESAAQFQKLLKAGRGPELKPENWLQLYLNLPRLAPWLGLGTREDFPALDLAFSSKGRDVRVTGVLAFAKPTSWRPDPWHIPRQTIKDPLVSFTAANGVAPWLEKFPFFQTLQWSATPNQVYGWSQAGLPLLIFTAAEAKNATNAISELAGKLPPAVFNSFGKVKVGEFFWASNRAEIFWQGLPIMAPHLKAVTETSGQYVVGELFPVAPLATNPPPELFAQVSGKNNLVYYSWEITEARINSWRQFFQLAPLFAPMRQVPTDFPAQKWLQAVAPLLENTITEITYVSPRQMNFTRRGNLGLSGFELVVLARALDLWGQPADFGVLKHPPSKAPAKP